MTTSTSTYVFDQAWQAELERLRSLEELFDPASRRHLEPTGVSNGWRCLEVGCGAGSIACWLADQVAPTGRVVAIDLDPRFLDGHGRSNLEVRQQDVVNDPLEPGSFDLIHARAVLMHLRERRAVFDKLVAALRPGGWLVIEDVDFGGAAAAMIARYFVPDETAAAERMYRAVESVFDAARADSCFGAKLTGLFMEAGLDSVGAEVHAPVVRGASLRTWVALTVEHLRPRLRSVAGLTDADVDQGLAMLGPRGAYLPPFMVTAWGRRA